MSGPAGLGRSIPLTFSARRLPMDTMVHRAVSERPERRALKARAFRRNLVQAAIIAAVAALMIGLGYAIRSSLAARGIAFSFGYLASGAGFEISEGYAVAISTPLGLVPFSSGMTNAQALTVGLFNTLKVAILAIVVATALGTLLGVGRLSTNWLVRQLCFYFVEFVRNTPLLIQLTFWYIAVVLQFPPISAAAGFPGVILSQQGIWLPSIAATDTATGPGIIIFLLALVLGVLSAFISGGKRRWVIVGLSAILLLGAVIVGGFPFTIDIPEAGRFRASGGTMLSPEFTAILIGIVVNSSAYLGEIVRGAIESLPRGQWEAARSLGLARNDIIKDIVLPQVFRVILPSFGNQYIGLAKNTSLGIAIGFPDLFNVYGTVANQTGRSLEGIIVVTLIYLLISLGISATINRLNARIQIPGAR
ncbi:MULTISPECIES: ABC transporter permease subunit [unclassified Mesorhizobium]|uniref:ABC transporter permease subunit n=1 Tax=unclassified Mesorhizobium TaxID=325217 RepID=UPI002414D95B|nr:MULTISPECIES: ABC transporter permease subunit [unclassified Mesorhizobium]MDG4889898.1 ABC transporter permease subunit [Mesorhizobium sp. WSM4887]MDG4904041.1 ABC transporter permease subunit [Mesorhizobium sp. WSM4962]MDG4909068.1 ABC transporter permease subunit [Mesorhizobium sp. WSM4898]MDG4921692.1 ABC transporter permease subunit [Mesorhizobium sp. WSM4989]